MSEPIDTKALRERFARYSAPHPADCPGKGRECAHGVAKENLAFVLGDSVPALLDEVERLRALLPTPVEVNGLRAVHFNGGPHGRAAEQYADRIVDALHPPGLTPPEADPQRVHRQELRDQVKSAVWRAEMCCKERDAALSRAEQAEADRSVLGVQLHGEKRQTVEAVRRWQTAEAALGRARVAALSLSEHVSALGDAADDNNPMVMATAGPIGTAEAQLFTALGIYDEYRAARIKEGT